MAKNVLQKLGEKRQLAVEKTVARAAPTSTLADVPPAPERVADSGYMGAGGGAFGRLRTLPITKIHPDPKQPRKILGETDLQSLANSIRINGLLQPILIRPHDDDTRRAKGEFIIVAGERRWRAVGLIGEAAIAARVVDSQNAAMQSLAENIHRVDLTTMEKALALKDVAGSGDGASRLSVRELESRVGLKKSYIQRLLKIAELPDGIVGELLGGRRFASSRDLYRVAQEPDADAQRRLFEELSTTTRPDEFSDAAEQAAGGSGELAKRSPQAHRSVDGRERALQRFERGTLVARQLTARLGELVGSSYVRERGASEDEVAIYRGLRDRLDEFLEVFESQK